MIDKIKKVLKNSQFRCDEECNINLEQVKNRVNSGAILIDVRSKQEYNEGHLHNAINIADYEITKNYKSMLPNKRQEIILYCQNGVRSKRALKKLKKLGYTNVYNLCGGLDNLR